MTETAATRPPEKISAGDTLDFTVDPGEFTSDDGYSPVFVFRSYDGAIRIVVNGTDSAGLFRITAAPSVTRAWVPADGNIWVFAELSDGSDRRTLLTGKLTILSDPASQAASDTRTHARKVLDAINAKLEGRASNDIASVSISGQSISMMSTAELLHFQSVYRARVQQEDAESDTSGRLARSRTIEPRFTR